MATISKNCILQTMRHCKTTKGGRKILMDKFVSTKVEFKEAREESGVLASFGLVFFN